MRRDLFPLAFAGNLQMVLYWKRPLFGVCWISGSIVWGRDLFPSICEEFADGAIQEETSFPLAFLAFLAFGTFGTGEGLLWYGICARCAKQAPLVRGAFSKTLGVNNRLFRYGSDIRYRKPPPLVPNAFSAAPGARRSPSVFLRAKGRK